MSNQNQSKPNAFSIRGTITEILEVKEFGKMSKRDFALTFSDGKYDQTVRLELIGDRMDQLEGIEEGDEVTVHFDLRGHKNQKSGAIYNNLTCWRIQTDADAPVEKKPQRHQKNAQYRQQQSRRKPDDTWSPGSLPVNGDGEIDF